MKEKSLFEILDAVQDEYSFILFLKALVKDRENAIKSEDKDDWQNISIESFFESAIAWAECSKDGLRFYTKSDNPWKRCADMIYMGKIYE